MRIDLHGGKECGTVLVKRLEPKVSRTAAISVSPRADHLQLRFWAELAQPEPKLLAGQRMPVTVRVGVLDIGIVKLSQHVLRPASRHRSRR